MTFRIDRHIPIPRPVGSDKSPKYPWNDMLVGDSFFVPGGNQKTLVTTANYARKSGKGRYLTRNVVEKGVKGVRVWRIK